VQNRHNTQEPVQTPNGPTAFLEPVGTDLSKRNTGEERWELSSPGTIHLQESQAQDNAGGDIPGFPGQDNEELEAKETEALDNPRQLNLYSFDATDKEIFLMIRQQVIDNRIAAASILNNNKHLGIGFLLTEYEEVAKLIGRVAPELGRFLQDLYPTEVTTTPITETQQTQEEPIPNPPEQVVLSPDTIRVTLKPDKITKIQEKIDYLSKHTVLARITGRNPGMRSLTLWARARLHRSFTTFTIRANNYLEIEFEDPVGRDQALEVQYYDLKGQTICILPWSPYFNYEDDYAASQPFTSLWVQIVDLPPFYRSKDLIQDFVSAFAEVISVDDTESYRTKLSGPRIRIITTDVEKLPKTLTLPRHDGRGDVNYKLAYSGLPEQCGRCRSYDHTVSQCKLASLSNQERSKHPRKRPHPPSTWQNTETWQKKDTSTSTHEQPEANMSDSKSTSFNGTSHASFRSSRQTQQHGYSYREAKKPLTEWRPVTKPTIFIDSESIGLDREQMERPTAQNLSGKQEAEQDPN
jgi:hypothetical protein